jgi:hypothetical protein
MNGAEEPGISGRPSLEEAQRLFFRAITWPQGAHDFAQSSGAEVRHALEQTFVSSAAFERLERLDVYANAYFYRLLSALREMFPRLAALAGDVGFHNLITDYVLCLPSAEPDLRRLGERLPAFLVEHALGRDTPLLIDLAALELAINRALDCVDGPRVTENQLRTLPVERWPSLRLTLSNPTQRLASGWDLTRVARASGDLQRDTLVCLEQGPRRAFLVGRTGYRTYFRELPADEAQVLDGFCAGATFGAVCAEMQAREPEFDPARMAAWLQRWLKDEVLGTLVHAGSEAERGVLAED